MNNISNERLIAFLHGQSDPELEQLLADNPTYQEQLWALVDLETQLTASLRQLKRPSPTELGEYQLGLLSEEKQQEVEAFLAQHPYLRQELAYAEALLPQPPPPSRLPTLKTTFRQLITLVEVSLTGVRDQTEDDSQDKVYEQDGIRLSLSTIDDISHPGYKALYGFVEADTQLSQAQLWLTDHPQPLATANIDQGDFLFSQLEPHTYELILSNSNTAIHIPNIIIQAGF